jgi:hypothetical protein
VSQKITVIEPHADDAFLSCHGHILKWIAQCISVNIVTLERDARRDAEAQEYAATVRATWGEPAEGQLVIPVGITHPDHIAARKQFNAPGVWLYFDMPYALVLRDNPAVNKLIDGLIVVSFMRTHANKWKNVEIFKSQKSYFSQYQRLKKQIIPSSFEMIFKTKGSPKIWAI